MNKFNFNQNEKFFFQGADTFIPLGQSLNDLDDQEKLAFQQKLFRSGLTKPKAIWGTLGWRNNSSFNPQGELTYSSSGNVDSKSLTLRQVEDIYVLMGKGKGSNFLVTERFVNLSNLDFGINSLNEDISSLPQLQLTLFLNPDEGAIVYYQHSKKGDYHDPDANLEYILPQSTDSSYSSNRDRLNYFIPVVPPFKEGADSTVEIAEIADRETDFIIKILTFKRPNMPAEEMLSHQTFNLNQSIRNSQINEVKRIEQQAVHGEEILKPVFNLLGSSKYDLMVYEPKRSNFISVSPTHTIDPDKRTLLLIHGTFASTSGSYGELYGMPNSTLDRLLHEGVFEQIIAFDHPTASHDVFDNVKVLYKRLKGIRFTHPVDLVGTSRGALLVKWLSSDTNNTFFTVGDIITFSGAFGVRYLTAGDKIAKGLSVLKLIVAATSAKFILALTQFSAKFIVELPGLDQMNPDSERLDRVMSASHLNSNTKLQTVVADWDKKLLDRGLKRLSARILDLSIKSILGKKHDWVVGYEEQSKAHLSDASPIVLTSMHVKNFDTSYSQVVTPAYRNTHEILFTYFKN